MSIPSPGELDFRNVARLTDQLLGLHIVAARPFLDMIVVNSTSATLVVVSDINEIEQATLVDLCVDLQAKAGEMGVLACLWQKITNEVMSIHTWIGVEPTVVHTQEVPL